MNITSPAQRELNSLQRGNVLKAEKEKTDFVNNCGVTKYLVHKEHNFTTCKIKRNFLKILPLCSV